MLLLHLRRLIQDTEKGSAAAYDDDDGRGGGWATPRHTPHGTPRGTPQHKQPLLTPETPRSDADHHHHHHHRDSTSRALVASDSGGSLDEALAGIMTTKAEAQRRLFDAQRREADARAAAVAAGLRAERATRRAAGSRGSSLDASLAGAEEADDGDNEGVNPLERFEEAQQLLGALIEERMLLQVRLAALRATGSRGCAWPAFPPTHVFVRA